eukprot:1345842-Prymnesium_polylepis.3
MNERCVAWDLGLAPCADSATCTALSLTTFMLQLLAVLLLFCSSTTQTGWIAIATDLCGEYEVS